MRVADFHFELPERLIADRPAEPRDAARLLVYARNSGTRCHRQVRDLPAVLRPGDLLILNDTRVLPHRLVGRRPTGGRVEALILERDGELARGYVKPARKIRIGQSVVMESGQIELWPLEDLGAGLFRLRLTVPGGGDPGAVLEAVGRAPLPPYIRRDDAADTALDRQRYQTVFAVRDGAIAAPTAGLHFSKDLLGELALAGIDTATVTLHVGEGTFAPLRVDRVEDHQMHREQFELPAATVAAIEATRRRGGRVVAVGTTAARVLESCVGVDHRLTAGTGWTDLFLYPGRRLRAIDALLTNFHLPESTLLMLVAAFIGRQQTLDLYAEAIDRGYRFYSFGDAMLML